eukprot:gene9692-6935_t
MLVLLVLVVAILCAATASNRDSYRVLGLEKYGAKDEMYAGLMSLDRQSASNGAFFFWLARKRQPSVPETKRRLVVWLNGGPGCSSMVGMMWENGPFSIDFGENGQKYRLKENPHSWNEVADVLFVEQPVRVGFSPAAEGARKVRSEDQVGEDFRRFLLSFLVDFPEYRAAELFLSGESYAGFYIPWIAEHIVSKQLVRRHDDVSGEEFYERDVTGDGINLVGAAIGNGVLDFLFQEPSYAEYAYYHGLIPLAAKERFDREWTQCLQELERDNKPLTRNSFNRCDMMAKVLEAAGQPNEYDTSTFRGYDRIVKAGGPFDAFFQDPEIQTALHVRGHGLPGLNFLPENYALVANRSAAEITTMEPADPAFYYEPPVGWRVCYDEMDDDMKHDHPASAVPVLQFLVDFGRRFDTDVDRAAAKSLRVAAPSSPPSTRRLLAKRRMRGDHAHLRVMLYSGEFDLNCNTLGTLHTLEHNWWRGRPWEEAERGLWRTDDGDVGGEYFHFDEVFSFLIVRNSGHLLPMDQPAVALAMLTRFLNNESFADQSLPKESFYRRPLPPMKAPASVAQGSSSVALGAAAVGLLGLCLTVGWLAGAHWHQSASKGLVDAERVAAPRGGRRGRTVLELTATAKGASGGSRREKTSSSGHGRATKRNKSETSPVARQIHRWEQRSSTSSRK